MWMVGACGGARVGYATQGPTQALEFLHFQGAPGTGTLRTLPRLAFQRQLRCAEPLSGPGIQRFDPQSLGSFIGNVKVAPVPAVAFGVAQSFPAAGLITGAGM